MSGQPTNFRSLIIPSAAFYQTPPYITHSLRLLLKYSVKKMLWTDLQGKPPPLKTH